MYSLEEMTQNLRINSPRDGVGLEGERAGGGVRDAKGAKQEN